MKYNFKDMLNAEIYENSRVIFILGRYNIFNNIVEDEFRERCREESQFNTSVSIADEFGFGRETNTTEVSSVNSVDLNTFLEVVGVPSINGKWYCKVDLASLNKKQKEALLKYAKEPSENGIVVAVSNDWTVYKDLLKNRMLIYSKLSNILELGFPNREVLKVLVKQLFQEKNINIDNAAIDFFIMRMSRAYNEYEEVIEDISTQHGEGNLELKQIKGYMKGIEYFTVEDFMQEIVKPLSSDKTNSKKILKMMISLQDELGAKRLEYDILKQLNDLIELRVLINTGYIPIGINYFYKDVIESIGGEKSKFGKMAEWQFKKKVYLASQTSLRDWEYMSIILKKAIENIKISDTEMELKCQKALYELCTRSVITEDRLNNIIGVDNILSKQRIKIDSIVFKDRKEMTTCQQ